MAKLRYMVDRQAVIQDGAVHHYEPIGVWVLSPPEGFDVYYLDGLDIYEQDGWQVLTNLVERDVKVIPDGFLEYHRDSCSPYHGSRGPIVETEQFRNADECGAAILDLIRKGKN